MAPRKQHAGPYATARAWTQNPTTPISRQRRSDYRRIAALGEELGRRLDELGATYALARWVAGPGPSRAEDRLARFTAAVNALEAGRVTYRRLKELRDAFTVFGVRKGDGSELRPLAKAALRPSLELAA